MFVAGWLVQSHCLVGSNWGKVGLGFFHNIMKYNDFCFSEPTEPTEPTSKSLYYRN